MRKQNPVTQSAESLARAAKEAAQDRGLPPVHLWNPPLSGDIDIRIARDGTWYHEGGEIRREALVRLFSSILKREEDAYFLVTPVEKWRITVEDAPFVTEDVEATGAGAAQVLRFTTQVGDQAEAGPDHPIRVTRDPETDEPTPYILIRSTLEARIDRKSFYRMIDLGDHHDGWFGVWSGGRFFAMIPSEELE
ncbi:MAG: DUF1285 domain-containing protein [Pelagimonas sp.]|jgi:hypothetical protein|nr:DUF1285 domain-containing protein [Pelagimonas sp.]